MYIEQIEGGPRIGPWGTPDTTGLDCEIAFLILRTRCT